MPRNEGEISHQTALAGKPEGIRQFPSKLCDQILKFLKGQRPKKKFGFHDYKILRFNGHQQGPLVQLWTSTACP